MVGVAYAVGKYALAECQKCGLRLPYSQLVSDGHWRDLRVCPGCYDPRHPQERLKRVSDPIALWRPAPESRWPPTAPVLSGEFDGTNNSLTWTAASSPDSAVAGYRLYRMAPGETQYTLLADLEIERSFIGEIEDEPLAYLDMDPPVGVYQYYVLAYDLRGLPSPDSNIVTITVTEPDPPVEVANIFTLKMLDHINLINPDGELEVIQAQYGPPSLGGFNTILYFDGSTFDYSDTGYCLAPGGVAARVQINLPDPLPPEMEYLTFYIEGDTESGWNSEEVTYAIGESGIKFSSALYVNVQLIELQYQDYPTPTLLVPATMQLSIQFEG